MANNRVESTDIWRKMVNSPTRPKRLAATICLQPASRSVVPELYFVCVATSDLAGPCETSARAVIPLGSCASLMTHLADSRARGQTDCLSSCPEPLTRFVSMAVRPSWLTPTCASPVLSRVNCRCWAFWSILLRPMRSVQKRFCARIYGAPSAL
jgi:hypothetical protein